MIEPIEIKSMLRLNIGGRVVKIDPNAIKAEKSYYSGNESWLSSDLYLVSADTDNKGVCVIQFLITTPDVSLPLFITYGQMADEWEGDGLSS